MVIIEHRGHAVKTETVKTVFLQPVFAIRQKKMEHLVLAVVKTQRIPSRMFTPAIAVEIKIWGTVKTAKTLHFVLHGMRMDNVHDHGDAEPVCLVDKRFQLLRSAEFRRCGKKAAHMIAERPVIGMLLYGHDLNAVIAVAGDTRQNLVLEFRVCAYAFLVLRHAYMAFVDQKRVRFRHKSLTLPFIRFVRRPDLSGKNRRIFGLNNPDGICRYALPGAASPAHVHFVELTVRHRIGRETAFPYAAAYRAQGILCAPLPSGKITHQHNLYGIRRPFPKHPRTIVKPMQTEITVSIGKIRKRAATGSQFRFLCHGIMMTTFDSSGKRREPRIVLNQFQFGSGGFPGFDCHRFNSIKFS